MFNCPHCETRSISAWRKFNASDLRPAACPRCGGLSCVPFGWRRALAGLIPELLFCGALVAAIVVRSAWALLAFPLGLLLYLHAYNALMELQPTEAAAVTRARWSVLRQLAFGAMCVLLAYWLFGRH